MTERLSDDDLVASGWQRVRPPESLTDEQIARITEAEADTPAGVLALLDEIDRLKAEAEEAEMEVETRGETIDRLRAQVADPGPSQAPESLSGELTAGTTTGTEPLSSCPHIVTDGTTSHCSLSEGRVREVERQRDIVIEAARALADDVGTYGRGSLVGRLVEQCDRAEGTG